MSIKSPSSPAGGRKAIAAAVSAFRQQQIPLQIIPSFMHANKTIGFDCPGCAFPDKPGKPLVDSCEQGQKAIAWEMTRRATGVDFFADKTPEQLRQLSNTELENSGRLTTPILYQRTTNRFSAITWDEAFDLIGREMTAIDPQQAAFYASGRSSNEAAFLWQLVARSFGCANLPDSSNFCHEPSGFALKQVIGVGKGTCTLDDFEHAELFIVMGQNPASNHPRMMAALHEARLRGAKILVLNPLKEKGFVNFADPKNPIALLTNNGDEVANEIYQVNIGGDLAALKGVIKALFDRETSHTCFDYDFINAHTSGIELLRDEVAQHSWKALETVSGLSEHQMRDIADAYAGSNATIVSWCMGITHQWQSVATIQYIVNLLLLKGNIGKKGAGAIPVRGHSNVQGDRTMGATSIVSEKWLNNLITTFPGAQICGDKGNNAILVIRSLLQNELKAFLSLGGNFGVAAPDSPRVLEALSRCRFTVHIATKLNRTHCYPGEIGLLLPTLGRTDIDQRDGQTQFVTTEDSMSNVRASRGLQMPLSMQQLSEPTIVANIGQKIARNAQTIPWQNMAADYGLIRQYIESCQHGVTSGFEHFQQRILEQGRIKLDNAAALRQWKTTSGKAEFRVHPLKAPPQPASSFTLMTIRSHDQFNTTVYSDNDRYRGVFGDRKVVLINQEDLNKLGIQNGQRVNIEALSDDNVQRMVSDFTAIAYDIPQGNLAAYYPEASALVSSASHNEETHTPIYKAVAVTLSPSTPR